MVVPDSHCAVRRSAHAAAGTDAVRWSVKEEDGSSREGKVSFASLAPLRSLKSGPAVECRRLVIPAPAKIGYHLLRLKRAGSIPPKCG
jgi:hypothetical protein